MGRNSGYIAMQASLASGQIDICLIPEVLFSYNSMNINYGSIFALSLCFYCINQVPFNLHGPQGVLNHLKYLLESKGSAVVCVAEGAGQVSELCLLPFSSLEQRQCLVQNFSMGMNMK